MQFSYTSPVMVGTLFTGCVMTPGSKLGTFLEEKSSLYIKAENEILP